MRNGEEVYLFRVVSEAEYTNIVNNSNSFVFYEWAIEKQWFAINQDHAKNGQNGYIQMEFIKSLKR